MEPSDWTKRLATLALDSHGNEPCVEYGCLMMIAVLRYPARVRMGMATVFMEFTNVLAAMEAEGPGA